MLLKSFKSGSYWLERAVTDIVPNFKKLLCNNVDTFTSKSLGSSQASWNVDSLQSAAGDSYGSGGLPRARLATYWDKYSTSDTTAVSGKHWSPANSAFEDARKEEMGLDVTFVAQKSGFAAILSAKWMRYVASEVCPIMPPLTNSSNFKPSAFVTLQGRSGAQTQVDISTTSGARSTNNLGLPDITSN